MKRRKPATTALHRGVATALAVALLVTSGAGAARAGGFPVIDTGNLATQKEQLMNLVNQVKEIGELKSLAEAQLSAFGEFGIMKDILGGAAFANLGSEADFYENMQKFGFDPCAINLCTVGTNDAAMTDIDTARGWVRKAFYAGRALNPAETRDLAEVRRRGVMSLSTNALALATTVHNDLATSGETAKSLEEIVQSSQNLRGDVRANSAVALAAYKVQIQQLAMLTAMVDVTAMRAIADTEIFDENGTSDEIPDAYIDTDFSTGTDRVRLKVTPPAKGSPSGGGSPFGGGLVGALMEGGPASAVASALGDSPASSIMKTVGSLGGTDSIASIATKMAGGEIPGVAGTIGQAFVMADGASLSSSLLRKAGNAGLAQNLDILQGGLSTISAGGSKSSGGSGVLMGLAGVLSNASGNTGMNRVIGVASGALRSGNTSQATSFIQGAVQDLTAAGNPNAANFLTGQLEKLSAGKIGKDAAVLDAVAMLSRFGSSPDSQIADVLSLDPTGLSENDIKRLSTAAIETAARSSGNASVSEVAKTLGKLDQASLERLNAEIAARKAAGQSGAASGKK